MTNSTQDFMSFLHETFGVTIIKQSPPGPPPRPGLTWNSYSHRWVREDVMNTVKTPFLENALGKARENSKERKQAMFVYSVQPGKQEWTVSNKRPTGGQKAWVVYPSGKHKLYYEGISGGYYS